MRPPRQDGPRPVAFVGHHRGNAEGDLCVPVFRSNEAVCVCSKWGQVLGQLYHCLQYRQTFDEAKAFAVPPVDAAAWRTTFAGQLGPVIIGRR